MRCKVGDLVVQTRSKAKNLGRVYTVIRFIGHVPGWTGFDRWEVDAEVVGNHGGRGSHVRDINLTPIRDTPGADETLQWAPVPRVAEVV